MKRDAAEILKDALALPTEARAALAGSLLDSLDTDVDEDAEAVGRQRGTGVVRSARAAPSRPSPGQRSAADSPRADAPVRGRIPSACCRRSEGCRAMVPRTKRDRVRSFSAGARSGGRTDFRTTQYRFSLCRIHTVGDA